MIRWNFSETGLITKFNEVGSTTDGTAIHNVLEVNSLVPNSCEVLEGGSWFQLEGRSSIFGEKISSSGICISMTEYLIKRSVENNSGSIVSLSNSEEEILDPA